MAEDYGDGSTRQTLLYRLRDQNDEKSWTTFVRTYRNYIYNIIRKMEINRADAEDIAQTVIFKVWEKLPDFRYDPDKGRFRSWLFAVTKNEVNMFFRKRRRNVEAMSDDKKEDIKEVYNPVDMPEIEKIAEKEWQSYISKLAWQKVQKEFGENVRKTFLMVMEGRATPEIAREVGISESSVYVYKKRAQDRLMEEINRLDYELS